MPIFYATSRDMSLKFDNNRALLDYLLSVEKKKLVVTIERETGVRSGNQNRYYWSCLEIIANNTGHNSSELHELFKRMFLPPKFINVLGKELKVPGSTTNLNKSEFVEYMMKIEAEVASMGITLPKPDNDIAPLR